MFLIFINIMFYVTFCLKLQVVTVTFLISLSWGLSVIPFPHPLQGQSVILVEYHAMCNLDTSLLETLQGLHPHFPPAHVQVLALPLRPLHPHLQPRLFCLPALMCWNLCFCLETPTPLSPLLPLEMANPHLACRSPLQPTAPGKSSLT